MSSPTSNEEDFQGAALLNARAMNVTGDGDLQTEHRKDGVMGFFSPSGEKEFAVWDAELNTFVKLVRADRAHSWGKLQTFKNILSRGSLPASSKSNLVTAAPYDIAASGVVNFGPSTGQTSFEFIGKGHLYRIRQTGSVQRVKFYLGDLAAITALYVKIWRKNGSNYDLVATSEDLRTAVTAPATNQVTLGTALTVAEGDYIGLRLEYSAAAAQNLFARTGLSGVTTYSVNNATPSATGYNWEGQTADAGKVVPVEVHMGAPMFVTIGDSIVSGALINYGFADSFASTSSPTSSMAYFLGRMLNVSFQNMGRAGETSGQVAARFNSDVVALAPQFVLIEGGVNDLLSSTSNVAILANWQSMIDLCTSAGIIPVGIGVLPFRGYGSATNAMLQQRDLLNALLKTAIETAGGLYINPDLYFGKFYAGGDPGNLWALQPHYAQTDQIHLTELGNIRFAQAIADALNDSNVIGGLSVSNLIVRGSAFLDGKSRQVIQHDRNPNYESAGFPLTVQAGGATPGATNKNGGTLYLASGISTGGGGSSESHVIVQTPGPGASGSADAVPSNRFDIYHHTAGAFANLFCDSGDAVFRVWSSSGGTYKGGIGFCAAADSFALYNRLDGTNPVALIGANIGIGTGTAAASSKLQVVGPTGADQNNAIIKAYAATDKGIWFAYDTSANLGFMGSVREGVAHDGICLAPIGGDVGIGLATAPQDRLHVSKAGADCIIRVAAGLFNSFTRYYSNGSYRGGIGWSQSSSVFGLLGPNHGDIPRLCIDTSDRVAIGAGITPADNLHLGAASGDVIFRIAAASANALTRFYDGTNYKGGVGWATASSTIGLFSLNNGTVPALALDTSDRVGIGLASGIDAKLHLIGSTGSDQTAAILKAYAAAGKGLWFAYDTATDIGYLGAVKEGVAHEPLKINAHGGAIFLGDSTAARVNVPGMTASKFVKTDGSKNLVSDPGDAPYLFARADGTWHNALTYEVADNTGPNWAFRKAGKAGNATDPIASGASEGKLVWEPWDGATSSQTASVEAISTEAFTTSAHGTKMQFKTTPNGDVSPVVRVEIPAPGGLVIGGAALATSATDGFLYVPTCAGAPSGTPTSHTGTVPVVYDTTNNQLCIYNGAWKKVTLT